MEVDRLLGINHLVARRGLGRRGWLRKPRRCLVAELISRPRDRTPASRRRFASTSLVKLPGSLAISATCKLLPFQSASVDTVHGFQDSMEFLFFSPFLSLFLSPFFLASFFFLPFLCGQAGLQKKPKRNHTARFHPTCFKLARLPFRARQRQRPIRTS